MTRCGLLLSQENSDLIAERRLRFGASGSAGVSALIEN
jgi:hypothetical protein